MASACWRPAVLAASVLAATLHQLTGAVRGQPAELANCVPRHGHLGCAAELYARLLCRSVAQTEPSDTLRRSLERQYERAGISFSGITASSVERDAIGRWVPQLCPSRSRQIQEVFAHLQRHHAD